MKFTSPLWLVIALAGSAAGQVQSSFESHISSLGDNPAYRESPLHGTFHFSRLPQPLDTAIVDFSLEEVNSEWDTSNATWHVLVNYDKGASMLLSDSVYLWVGRHRRGDKIDGTLRFVPLTSGSQSILLYKVPPKIWDMLVRGLHPLEVAKLSGVSFEWCLDDDGHLTFLGSTEGKPLTTIACSAIHSTFYREGYARLYPNPAQTEEWPFDYWVELPTLPTIGDTTRVIYHLKAQRSLPRGLDLDFFGRCVDVVQGPSPVAGPIQAGDSISFGVTVRPRAVRDEYCLTVHVSDPAASSRDLMREEMVAVGFVFRGDGHLRYFGDGRWSVPVRLWPSSYADPIAERDYGELRVKSTDR